MTEIWESLKAALDRAIQAVGVLPALLALAATGAIMAARAGDARWLILALFGAFGAAEVYHRQQKAHLIARRQPAPAADLVHAVANRHPDWHVKVLQEFHHGGLRFRALGFEELEIPLAVAGPLCPRCGGHLTERIKARFPLRY